MLAQIKKFVDSYPKISIFATALILRLVLGWIFYGGADINSFLGITQLILNKQWLLHPVWCYFPTICFHLWFCGWLCATTALPTAFCIKIVPILFDALLAVLIYDIVKKMTPQLAQRSGFLYAFCPVAIIVACIHGQWDAYVLLLLALAFYIRDFYQDSYIKYAAFGTLFALSFLLKPYTLLFAFFFFTPHRGITKELGKAWGYLKVASLGLAAIAVGSFLVFKFNRALTINMVAAHMSSIPMLIVLGLGTLACVALLFHHRPWHHFSPKLQQYCRYQTAAILGASITTILCFLCFMYYDFSIAAVVDTILRYSNQAAPTLGLPFAYPVVNSPLFLILKNRLWVLLVIGGIAGLYYQERINIFKAIAASFALVLGVNGLVPSYFVFLPPFLLMSGLYKVSALYNLAASAFYIFYYANPLANAKFPYESILGYVPLTSWSWLTPSQWLTDERWVPLIRFLSNYLLPVISLGVCIYLLKEAWQKTASHWPHKPITEHLSLLYNPYLLVNLGVTLGIALCHLLVTRQDLGPLFETTLQKKLPWYNIATIPGYITGAFPLHAPFNILFILGALALVWSFVAYKTAE